MWARNLLIAGAAAYALSRLVDWMNRWGADAEEQARAYPGDELIAEPADQATMAVSVDAEPERIWSWLVQIGQDRGGMYSYDRLERAIGLRISSAQTLRDEWQRLASGDRVQLVPPGWGPLPDGYAFKVARAERPRVLVLRQGPPEDPWDGVWTFVIRPDGPGRCRLITRMRTRRPGGPAGPLLRAATWLGVPITWLMTRKMLLTLKERAERP